VIAGHRVEHDRVRVALLERETLERGELEQLLGPTRVSSPLAPIAPAPHAQPAAD
jgi:hypothetical protein